MPADLKELRPLPVEKIPTPESGLPSPEKNITIETPVSEKREPVQTPIKTYQPQSSQTAPVTDDSYRKYKQIESVLEEDLGEIYNNLTPAEQKAFKIKGEETTRSIFQLVYQKTKIKVKKIVKLIRNWLKAVPGINKFFLEQEAKIKADKIVALTGESKKIEF